MRSSNSPPSYGNPQDAASSVANRAKGPGRLERNFDPAGVLTSGGNPFKTLNSNTLRNTLDPAGIFGGGGVKAVKGSIDPTTGTVNVSNYGKDKEALSAAFTNYLRTGDKGNLRDAGGAFRPLKRQIQELQATGWKYGTPSAGMPTVLPGQGPVNWGPQPGNPQPPPRPPTFAPPGQLPPQMQPPGGMPQQPPMQGAPQMQPSQRPPMPQLPSAPPSRVAEQYAQAQALRPTQQQSMLRPYGG
jgi:hypothetical protein